MLRQVGNLERFSTARHSLGMYRSVALTARYSTAVPSQAFPQLLPTALAAVILQHPALCCGIINEDKDNPSFIRLESIDLSQCIEYRTLATSTADEHQHGLIRIIEQRHSQLWDKIDCLPPWKLIIVQSNAYSSKEKTQFDAIFAFHHAIGDGLSGMAFHRSLLSALSSAAPKLFSNILTIPSSTKLSPAVEDCVKFNVSWFYLIGQLWQEYKPRWLFRDQSPPWTSTPISPESISDYTSRVDIRTFPSSVLSGILSRCRVESATLTGLLHGVIVASLSTRVPQAQAFTSTTPYSLRHLAGLSTDEIGVQVSSLDSVYDTAAVASIRTARTPEQLTKEVWIIARSFRSSMTEEIARLPNDSQLGLIPYISSMHEFFKSKVGKPRSTTYEVSNVGGLKIEGRGEEWGIERVVFTQSGSATGAAIGVNVSSAAGGDLAISFTWLQGDVEEKLVGEVMEDVEYALKCVGQGKDILVGL